MPAEPRKRIPADVERQVFIDAGHRCAVCGTPFPLERAHIIPWRNTADNSARNLICLCANCHESADKDWDEKTLQEYKARPWVNRQHSSGPASTNSVSTLQISIALRAADDGGTQVRWLRYALAAFLNICPDRVSIRVAGAANSGASDLQASKERMEGLCESPGAVPRTPPISNTYKAKDTPDLRESDDTGYAASDSITFSIDDLNFNWSLPTLACDIVLPTPLADRLCQSFHEQTRQLMDYVKPQRIVAILPLCMVRECAPPNPMQSPPAN